MARQSLVAADREVTKLTAEAETADAELSAKRQRTRAPLKAWEKATEGWSAKQWSEFEAAEQKRRAYRGRHRVVGSEHRRGRGADLREVG